jgi:DNA-binding NtrC family response regulator
MQRLLTYSWPGNIRELKNVIERAVIVSEGRTLTFDWWILDHPTSGAPDSSVPLNQTLEQIERDHILAVIEKCHWRINGEHGAAEVLAMHPNTLRSKMKKLGIKRPQGQELTHLQEN